MKVLLAVDKFKGSLSAADVCKALEQGLSAGSPTCVVESLPLADGGDGSLNLVAKYTAATSVDTLSRDPLGRKISTHYLLDGQVAYVELAVSSGMVLLAEGERNPMHTSTIGTGEIMLAAVEKGAKQIFLFLGGSCTTDAGLGIASALGCHFLDVKGRKLLPVGGNLLDIEKVSTEHIPAPVRETRIQLVCDVNNPLYGPRGAAYVYGPQKGASITEVEILDRGLRHVAKLLKSLRPDIADVPGTGAAGGIAAGLGAIFGADITSGTDFFADITNLAGSVSQADLIITGEGCIDQQTPSGKVVSGVLSICRAYQKPVLGVCGIAHKAAADGMGFEGIYSIRERSKSDAESMDTAYDKLVDIGAEIAKTYEDVDGIRFNVSSK